MKINAVIIEDELNARKALENMLAIYSPDVEVIGTAESVKEGVKLLKEAAPDLVFLDVQLTDGTGFDLLNKISNRNFKLVFTTAHDQYALKAIKLSALDYLLKPLKPKEIRQAVSKVRAALEDEEQLSLQIDTCVHNFNNIDQEKKLILNTSDRIFVVEVKNLVHCEASDNYTDIYILGDKKITTSKTLKTFEELLSAYGFFRIHQSHLINMRYVESVEKKGNGMVLLSTGERLPVSLRKKQLFIQALNSIT